MVRETSGPSGAKLQLSRELVFERAMDLADHTGLDSLTMRSLAVALGVKPMSIYYYVAKKSEILDGLVDRVFEEAASTRSHHDSTWQQAMRERAVTMRAVLARHHWALGLIESRTSPGPATLQHHNETLGILRSAGFSIEAAARAYAVLDSYIYGFVLQESTIPVGDTATVTDVAASMLKQFESGQYPHLLEVATAVVMKPGYDFGSQFEDGLDLVIHGLESWLDS